MPQQVEHLALFLTVGSAAAVIFAMAKSGFGGEIGILAVPMMAYACGGNAQLATGIMLPMLIAADYLAAGSWWKQWNVREVLRLLPGAILGITLGTIAICAFRSMDVDPKSSTTNACLTLAIGLISLAFVILHFVRKAIGQTKPFKPTIVHAIIFSVIAGFTSTLAHAAGPIIAMYLLPQNMKKQRFVATTALFFWAANQIKLVPYYGLGMINTDTLSAGLLLVPAIAAGAILGKFLHTRIGDRQFTGIIYTLLTLAGIDLCRKGIITLLG